MICLMLCHKTDKHVYTIKLFYRGYVVPQIPKDYQNEFSRQNEES